MLRGPRQRLRAAAAWPAICCARWDLTLRVAARRRASRSVTSASAAAAGFARALLWAAAPDMPGPGVPVPVAAPALPGRVGVPAGHLSRRRGLLRLEPARFRRRLLRLLAHRLGLLVRRERLRLLRLGLGRRLLGPLWLVLLRRGR